MITINQLFNESFEPLWLTKQKQRAIDNLDESLTARTNFNFREEALESLRRISGRVDQRGNYSNTC